MYIFLFISIEVIEHPELQDGMKVQWNTKLISSIVEEFVIKHQIDEVCTILALIYFRLLLLMKVEFRATLIILLYSMVYRTF